MQWQSVVGADGRADGGGELRPQFMRDGGWRLAGEFVPDGADGCGCEWVGYTSGEPCVATAGPPAGHPPAAAPPS